MVYLTEPEQLVTTLVAAIAVADIENSTRPIWTKAIKDILHGMFHDQHTDVLCTSIERDTQEFMLDVAVWNRVNGEGLALAVESEWDDSPVELVRDFEKLLVIKSSLKLMIFASYSTASQKTLTEALYRSLLSYKHHEAGERYVFADFAPCPMRRACWLEIPALQADDRRLRKLPAIQEITLPLS